MQKKIKEMGKRKIVIGINDFVIGGAQKMVADILNHFDREKFEVHLVTLMQFVDKNDFYDLVPNDIKTYKLNFKGFSDLKSWGELFKLLKQIKPNIVWSHLFFSNTVFRILGIFLGYKRIATEHNTYTWKNFFHKCTDKLLSLVTYKIVAVSNTVKSHTVKQEKISEKKFLVIHNGVDTAKIEKEINALPDESVLKSEFGFSAGEKILVNVSRLISQKNHKLLLSGFALFNKVHPEYKLAVIGEGGLMDGLKNQAKDLGISDAVIFFGHRRDVFSFYKIAQAFVSTSLIEGLSVAYLESLASGVPIVATKTAGTDEIIKDGSNGIFIEAFDEESVARTFEKMHQADMEVMRQNAKETAQSFDLANIADQYEKLFIESVS